MSEPKTGWALLHSQLPPKALKELDRSVYGVGGLTDVNEGYLIQRLFASGFSWEWSIEKQEFLGNEDRTSQSGNTYRVYFASVHGVLLIDGRQFHGSGASENRKLDAAFKGAATVAFKNACKVAGLTAELYLDGRAIDHIYESREKIAATRDGDNQGARTDVRTPTSLVSSLAPAPIDGQGAGGAAIGGKVAVPPQQRTPQEIAAEARKHVRQQ